MYSKTLQVATFDSEINGENMVSGLVNPFGQGEAITHAGELVSWIGIEFLRH